ncbi:ATP-dependent Clp protease ATP-binding subunit ClpA homolog CD4B, chloroplastic-like protein [Tanacetum coccineum]
MAGALIHVACFAAVDRQKKFLINGTGKSKRAGKMMCNTYASPMRMRTFSGLRGSKALDNIMRTGTDFHSEVAIATILGLIGEGTGTAAKVLKSMGINLKDARVKVEKIIGRDCKKEEEGTFSFNYHQPALPPLDLTTAEPATENPFASVEKFVAGKLLPPPPPSRRNVAATAVSLEDISRRKRCCRRCSLTGYLDDDFTGNLVAILWKRKASFRVVINVEAEVKDVK